MMARHGTASTPVVVRQYPAICPVCAGCGTVPHDFYTRFGVSTSTAREACRSCGGLGTIMATETIPAGLYAV